MDRICISHDSLIRVQRTEFSASVLTRFCNWSTLWEKVMEIDKNSWKQLEKSQMVTDGLIDLKGFITDK